MSVDTRHLFISSLVVLATANTTMLWGRLVVLALFLGAFGIEALALGLLAEALLSLVFIASVEQLKGVFHEFTILGGLCLVGLLMIALSAELLAQGFVISYVILYATQRILRDLLFIHAWRYISSHYSSHLQYLLMPLNVYSRMMFIPAGVVLALLSLVVEAQSLILFWWGALLATLLSLTFFADEFPHLRRVQSPEVARRHMIWERATSALATFAETPMTRLLGLSALSLTMALSVLFYKLVDQLWASAVSEEALIGGLALLTSVVTLLALPIRYVFLPRALNLFGMRRVNLLYTLWLSISVGLIAFVPGLVSAAVAEFTRTSLRFSIHNPIHEQMRYTLPTSLRNWAKTLLDGLLEPLGRLLGAALLILLIVGEVSAGVLFLVVAGVLVVLLWAQHQAGRLYTQHLNVALAEREYGLLRKSLRERLTAYHDIEAELVQRLAHIAPDDPEVLLMGEALSQNSTHRGFVALTTTWERLTPALQAEVLLLLAQGWPEEHQSGRLADLLDAALASDTPALQATALRIMRFYPALLDDYRVAEFLLSPHVSVSIAAARILLQHPAAGLSAAAQAHLRWLSRGSDPRARAQAVEALVQGGLNRFGERVIAVDTAHYLADESAHVRMSTLPAATQREWVYATGDISGVVRNAALAHLRTVPRAATRRLLDAIYETVPQTLPQDFQFATTIRYWHYMGALGAVNRALVRGLLPDVLPRGLHQLDRFSGLIRTLNSLERPALQSLMIQLQVERAELLRAMMHTIGAVHGETHVRTLTRSIQDGSPAVAASARDDLARLISPAAATALCTVLNSPHHATPTLIGDAEWGITTPAQAAGVLLNQNDLWWGMLSLFALSSLPRRQFDDLCPAADVQAVLERGRRSALDAIRDGARLLREALYDHPSSPALNLPAPALNIPAGITEQAQAEAEKGRHMLSVIERMLFLRQVAFFESLRLDQLRTLGKICQEMSLNAGEHVLRKGEASDSLYIVVEGEVNITDPDRPNIQRRRQAGDMLGEISLFDGGLHAADAMATAPTLLLVIHRTALDDAIGDDPGIALNMLRTLAHLLRKQDLGEDALPLSFRELTDNVVIQNDKIDATPT